MIDVKVVVKDKNQHVAAMVRGLAWSVQSNAAVSGATRSALERDGFIVLHISEDRIDQFLSLLDEYFAIGLVMPELREDDALRLRAANYLGKESI